MSRERMRPAEAGMAGIIEDGQQSTTATSGRRMLRAACAIAIAGLCAATGCSGFFVYPGNNNGGGGSNSTGDFVYVANSSTANLAGFSVGSGTITAVANSPYALTVSPVAVAINPANTILYVACNPGIYAYAIQSTGALSALNGGSAVATTSVVSMDVSPDGQWLLALDGSGAAVDEYRINSSTGGLTPQLTSFSVKGAVSHAIKVTPNAQFVFVALGTAGELVFPFNTAAGTLSTPTQFAPPAGTSDDSIAIDPNSAYLYIGRSGSAGSGLAVDAIGSGGALGAVNGSPFAAGNQPASERSVVLNKAGTYVYVTNFNDSTISGFSIGSGGQLTPLSGSPYSAGSNVIALAMDNSGKYLLAVSLNGSPDLAMYSFDSMTLGKLDFAASTATGTDPTIPVAVVATH